MNHRLIISGENKRKEYFSLNKSPFFKDVTNAIFSSEQIKSFEIFKKNFSNLFELYFPASFSDYNNDVNLEISNFVWNEPRFSEKECMEHSISYEYKIDLLWNIKWHCKKMQFKPEGSNLYEVLENWVKSSFRIGSFSLTEESENFWKVDALKKGENEIFSLEIKITSVQEDRIIIEFDCARRKNVELCSIPKINKNGNFIINGHEKVVVFQSVRSPGIYFFLNENDEGKLEKVYSEIIPLKGPWVSIFQDTIKDKSFGSKKSLKLKFLNSGVSINFFNIFNSLGIKLEKEQIEELFLNDEEISNSFLYGDKEEKKQTPSFLFEKNNSYFSIGEIGRKKLNKRVNIVNRMFGLKLAQDIISKDNKVILKNETVLLGDDFKLFKNSLISGEIDSFKIPQIEGINSTPLYCFKVFSKNNPEKIISLVGWKDDQSEKKYFDVVDFICSLSLFSNARNGIGKIEREEDKDRLDNQIIRRVGDLIQNIFDNRLGSFVKSVEDKYVAYISQLKRIDLLKIPNIKDFDALLKSFFNSSTLIQLQNQNNPISEASYLRKVSVLGLGGLNSVNASLTVRNVNPSYYGRYDLVETPEGQKVGLLHSLTINAQIDELGQVRTPYYKVLNGKITDELHYLTAEDEIEKYICHCSIKIDENNLINEKKVLSRYNNKFVLIDAENVDYIDSSFYQLNSVNSASIPFFQHNDSTRMLMACNMQKQAVVTLANESPFVASGTEESLLRNSPLTVLAEEDGIVEYVDSTKVVVNQKNSSEKKVYSLDQFLNSNKNSFFTSFVQVRKGDSIKKGQVISHGNYGRQKELSLGANLRVAFLTWNSNYAKAGGYEDSIIISSKVANSGSLTSFYNTDYTIVRKNTKHGEEEFSKNHLNDEARSNLDDDGIIKVGSKVKEGDILVGKITPEPGRRGEVEELLFSSVFGDKLHNLVDTSFKLPYGESGIIRSVKKVGKEELKRIRRNIVTTAYSKNDIEVVKINVTQTRHLEIGDKLTTRFGNKGVVSKIVPEIDMPFDSEGNRVDIIFNPLSVPSRMNIGQLLESLLGLAAHKLGSKYLVRPFNTPDIKVIKEILEEAKIKNYGLVKLYDGQTGIPFSHEVLVGYIYTMKLNHMVSDKFHSRNTGPYSLIYQQPVKGRAQGGGQRVGEMEVWALESHGAAFNIMEMMGAKSDDLAKRREFNNSLIFGDKKFSFTSNQSESFNLLIQYLRGLGFDLEVTDWNNKEVDLYKFFERSNNR